MLWEVVKLDDYIIRPVKQRMCPIRGYHLLLHDFRAWRAAQGFHHVDVHMKCVNCGLYLTFGVPISEDDFKKLLNSRYNGKILTDKVLELTPEDLREEVERRLRSWGYW
jgi:hypothetical protein